MIVRVEPYNPEEHSELCASLHLRKGDEIERAATGYADTRTAILASLETSEKSWVIFIDADICGIFGLSIQGPESSRFGVPWLLITDQIKKFPTTFLKRSKRVVDGMFGDGVTMLQNYVWLGHTDSIRWLKWLGFTIDLEESYVMSGLTFVKFYKYHGDC